MLRTIVKRIAAVILVIIFRVRAMKLFADLLLPMEPELYGFMGNMMSLAAVVICVYIFIITVIDWRFKDED